MPFGNPDWPNNSGSINIPLQKQVWDQDRWTKSLDFGNMPFTSYQPFPSGWICPRCHIVHSPSTSVCVFCYGKSNDIPSDNTDSENEIDE